MKPQNLKTEIFLDGGNPEETKAIIRQLGFLDGQTTNPSLVAKHPHAEARVKNGEKFTRDELLGFYREIVQEISALIPDGSVSIEVYADRTTSADEMLEQARQMFQWIPNAHIKFPIIAEGLAAAQRAIKEGIRINMTLCFTLEQAAAVYAATRSAKRGDVFVSPFIGRLDDRGENGIDLVSNIVSLYRSSDHHVEILAASVRNLKHFFMSMANQSDPATGIPFGADIITAPASVLKEWYGTGMRVLRHPTIYRDFALQKIPYQPVTLDQPWTQYDITHELTDKGLERFAHDWNQLLK